MANKCIRIYIFIYLILDLKLWPPTRRYIVFGADPVGIGVRVAVSVHFFVSLHYLLNQLMIFDKTCIYTLLGEGKELIRFW